MAPPTTGGSQIRKLGTILDDWVRSHNGRMWYTKEELSEIIKATGFNETQVKNSFDHRRRRAKVALTHALKEPEVFLSKYDHEEAKTLKSALTHAATTGYLAEPAKELLAESTGLSSRAVIDFIAKNYKKAEFAGIAAGIANVELRDPSTAPTDVASHAATKFAKEPNRIHTTLADGGSLFAGHRGRQVNLTTEVAPLLSSFPGVESATCFS